ncbi:hypothetical protein QYE76_019382 [Lolium multiflorum]|uniref:Uncharacterized protein n=1 Tax=Lolium multiflorum TaxID=4521 RepID=A0AAD8VQY8_LOLMU|nr:hypothetical protein QYE76_019382 [Lolium multiflorum]
MVKKKGTIAAASTATSATGPKAVMAAAKRAAPDAAATIAGDAPGDWTASTMTKRDEKKARCLGLISDREEDICLLIRLKPPGTSAAQPPKRPSGSFTEEDDLLFDSEDFASQYTLLQAENARLQQDAGSKSTQLDQAVTTAATARQEADSLKKELGQLKKKLKEEEREKEKAEAQVQAKDKEDKLRNSIMALLGATDIPANTVGKPPADSAADAISLEVDSSKLVRALLQKNKAILSRFHAMIFPKADQNKTVTPVAPFVEDASAASSGTCLLQQMRTRISWMEKDLLRIHAMAAVIKKKGEVAMEAERYTLSELQQATESLNFIALNLSDENKRVHERVEALMKLSQFNEVFWTNKSKVATIAKFQYRVQQVHRFFDKCHAGLRMIWKAMFPLNPVPPTLLAFMSNFRNPERVRALVRSQLLTGAEIAFAFVLSQHPSLDLEAIAKADADVNQYFPIVRDPASIIVARLEVSSEANYAVEAPH